MREVGKPEFFDPVLLEVFGKFKTLGVRGGRYLPGRGRSLHCIAGPLDQRTLRIQVDEGISVRQGSGNNNLRLTFKGSSTSEGEITHEARGCTVQGKKT